MGRSHYMTDDSFRQPVKLDEEGGYITRAQLRFFINRRRGFDKIENLHDDFIKYTEYCKIYNYLWDCSERESSVVMYWDPEKQTVAFTFPQKGVIADTITKWKD